MFSPYYAWRGRKSPGDHCAINIGLYGDAGQRWTMTERRANHVDRSTDTFVVGPSSIEHSAEGDMLTLRLDELAAPLPRRVRGTVRVHLGARTAQPFNIDVEGRHQWWPIAPSSRVEVDLRSPSVRWSGPGYVDTNAGTRGLEDDFTSWDWSRAHRADGSTMVLYDTRVRDASDASGERDGSLLALKCATDGTVEHIDPTLMPGRQTMGRCFWGVQRHTRCDDGATARVVQTLEDSPFYSRSIVDTQMNGEPMRAMHESLSGDRFASPIVRAMLPFKMPRAPLLWW